MSDNNNNKGSASFPLDSLPDGFLVDIVPFLSTNDGANFTSTNHKFNGSIFRGQVLSQVTKLEIKENSDMNPALGRLFPSVKKIHFSVKQSDEFLQLLIPFVVSFPNLQIIEFVVFSQMGLAMLLQVPEVKGGPFKPEILVRPVEKLLRTLGDAYAAGTLSDSVRVDNPLCPLPHPGGALCTICLHFIRTFPPKHVISYDSDRKKLILKLLDPGSMMSEISRIDLDTDEDDNVGRDWPIEHREINLEFVARPGGRDAMMRCFLAMQDAE